MEQTIYEVLTFGTEPMITNVIQRTDPDGKIWSIPIDPANSDYQEYLKYLEDNEE
jgi:hypothetical protein